MRRFLQKSQLGGNHGFEPTWLPDFLKPFQAYLVDWIIRRGRGLLAEDCGLGKTPQLIFVPACRTQRQKPAGD